MQPLGRSCVHHEEPSVAPAAAVPAAEPPALARLLNELSMDSRLAALGGAVPAAAVPAPATPPRDAREDSMSRAPEPVLPAAAPPMPVVADVTALTYGAITDRNVFMPATKPVGSDAVGNRFSSFCRASTVFSAVGLSCMLFTTAGTAVGGSSSTRCAVRCLPLQAQLFAKTPIGYNAEAKLRLTATNSRHACAGTGRRDGLLPPTVCTQHKELKASVVPLLEQRHSLAISSKAVAASTEVGILNGEALAVTSW